MMVFDKTGTLTEDCLKLHGYLNTERSENTEEKDYFGIFAHNCESLTIFNASMRNELLQMHFLEALASCHSITYVED